LNGIIGGAESREDDEIDKDLHRLFSDGRGPNALYGITSAACGGPRTSYPEADKKKGEDVELPAVTLRRLEESAKGCVALIAIWKTFKDRAQRGLEIQANDRFKAVRMLGLQPVDVVNDERVWLVFFASFVLHPGERKHAFVDLKSDMRTLELEAFVERPESRWPGLLDPNDKAKAKQMLVDLAQRNIERLEAKREAHLEHADDRAASRARLLAYDESPQGERLGRHELACERRVKRCREAFWKHRREVAREENREVFEVENRSKTDAGGDANKGPEEKRNNEPSGVTEAAEFAVFKEFMTKDEEVRRMVKELAERAEVMKKIESGELSMGELLEVAQSPLMKPTS
jgi:hypothetical protein